MTIHPGPKNVVEARKSKNFEIFNKEKLIECNVKSRTKLWIMFQVWVFCLHLKFPELRFIKEAKCYDLVWLSRLYNFDNANVYIYLIHVQPWLMQAHRLLTSASNNSRWPIPWHQKSISKTVPQCRTLNRPWSSNFNRALSLQKSDFSNLVSHWTMPILLEKVKELF